MERLRSCLFVLLVLLAFNGNAVELWVASNGLDNNPGTKEKPLASLSAALRKARELRRVNDASIKEGLHIVISGGTYQLLETVILRPEDAGTASSPTFIEAAPNEKPILSGGVQISGWKKLLSSVAGLPAAAKAHVWVADAPMVNGRPFEFRQLWVNDVKAIRAKSVKGDAMLRILNWNKKDESCWIPTPGFAGLQKVNGIELFIHQWWAIAMLRIKKMEVGSSRVDLQACKLEYSIVSPK